MDFVHIATLVLGAGLVWVVATSIRRRWRLELRARVFELVGAAARRGLPLGPAIRRMADGTPGSNGLALRQLADRLDAGEPFAASFEAALPAGTLPAEVIATIRASEGTSALQDTLENLARSADQIQRAQERIATALAYPSLLAVALIGTYAMTDRLLSQLPEGAGSPGGVAVVGTYVAAIVMWSALALALASQSSGLRGRLHDALVAVARRIPGLGKALYLDASSRVLRVAAALSAAGLPLGEILRRAANATCHVTVRDGILDAARSADGGMPADQVWRRSGLPEFAVEFASLATRAEPAEIARRLRQAAQACDRRVHRGVSRAIAAIQPAAIAVFGVLIALHFAMVVEHVQNSRMMTPGGAPW